MAAAWPGSLWACRTCLGCRRNRTCCSRSSRRLRRRFHPSSRSCNYSKAPRGCLSCHSRPPARPGCGLRPVRVTLHRLLQRSWPVLLDRSLRNHSTSANEFLEFLNGCPLYGPLPHNAPVAAPAQRERVKRPLALFLSFFWIQCATHKLVEVFAEEVDVETEWWRGRMRADREGRFPRNVVEMMETKAPLPQQQQR